MTKVLVIRFSSLGDLVLTSALVRCIKQQLKAEIHFVTKSSFASILTPNPNIDHVWTIQKSVSELNQSFRRQPFDYVIDLHKNIRSWQVKSIFPNARALTYQKGTLTKWRRIYLKSQIEKKHVVDRYLDTVSDISVVNDGKGLDFFIDCDQKIEDLVPVNKEEYVVAVIGAMHFTKRLPTEKWIQVLSNYGRPVVLIGGADVAQAGNQIAAAMGSTICNRIAQASLMESALIVQNAKGVISNDTGFMHIAAALQRPLVSLWGSTDPDLGFWPYYPHGSNIPSFQMEVTDLACRPCSKFGKSHCPKGHFKCMKELSDAEIVRNMQYF